MQGTTCMCDRIYTTNVTKPSSTGGGLTHYWYPSQTRGWLLIERKGRRHSRAESGP
jgi:hypothetical protein